MWVSGSLHPPSQGFRQKLTYSDSRAPSATAVGTFGTQGSAGLFVPTPGHLSISEYGEDSGQREKSGDQGEWRLRERSGNTDTREQGTEKVEGGDRADFSILVLLGPGPGDGMGTEGGTGRPGGGDRCWIAPARFP